MQSSGDGERQVEEPLKPATSGAPGPRVVRAAGGAGDRADASPLEPNHTHQVLVPGSSWGEESPWLADIATWLADRLPSNPPNQRQGDASPPDAPGD